MHPEAPPSKAAAASACYPAAIAGAGCVRGLHKVNVCWAEIYALAPTRRGDFSSFGSFRPFSPGWDPVADACCKSYRGNKRSLVLNIHAVPREQFPHRCAIRVIPPFWRSAHEEEKKLTPSLWFIVLSSGPLRHRFSLSGPFRC